jgi:uncharacterized repeat protein (TIGR03803 family)
MFLPIAAAHAQESTLLQFSGGNGGNPPCGLISGGKGLAPGIEHFFGATQTGGAYGYGAVYEVTNTGAESVLYSFTGGSDGAYPRAGLIEDASGNYYGTTDQGGAYGSGVVFKLAPGDTETVLHSFGSGTDGAAPLSGLVMDSAGNLYGTTFSGGANGLGTVFEVAPGGSESVLHSFAGSDGALPMAALVMDTSGNLYGTTYEGGASANCGGGCGVVFELAGSTETVLHSFSGSDGANPEAALLMTGSGNLYSTTENGGANGVGTVFEVSHKGKEVVLYSFGSGGGDGAYPASPVVKKSGYFYGTTANGGGSGYGTVYRIPVKGGSDTVLYSFTDGSDGGIPQGGLLYQSSNFFGTTFEGGNPDCAGYTGCGTVFEVKP